MVIGFRDKYYEITSFKGCFSSDVSWFTWFVMTRIIVLSPKHSMTFSFYEYVKVRKGLIAWKVVLRNRSMSRVPSMCVVKEIPENSDPRAICTQGTVGFSVVRRKHMWLWINT